MFESKLILKLPPFSLTYTVRDKGGNFKMSLLSNMVRLFLICLGSNKVPLDKEPIKNSIAITTYFCKSAKKNFRKNSLFVK